MKLVMVDQYFLHLMSSKSMPQRILPKILPTGRESIEFEADTTWTIPHVKVYPTLSSFNVDKLGNGMRKIELNGKELLQADFTNKEITWLARHSPLMASP